LISPSRDSLQRLVSVSIRWPKAVLFVWILIAAISSLGVVRLEVDTGTSAFLDRLDPAWEAYQNSVREFGGDEVVVVAFEGERAYDLEVLTDIIRYTTSFGEIPGVRRVDSIASVPSIHVTPEGSLSLDPALNGDGRLTTRNADSASELLRNDRIAPRNLVSDSERVFAINLFLDEDIDRGREVVVSEVRRVLEGKRAWISGVPVFRTEVNSRTRSELVLFVPLTLFLVGCVVYFGSRSLLSVIVSLAASGVGAWILLGAMGALGTPLSLSTMILPSILLALGCAYIMHILSAAQGASSADVVEEAVISVSRAVALSGLTTAIGFLAMSTVRIDAIRELGVYGAIGVLSILLSSLSLVPAALSTVAHRNIDRFRNVGLREIADRVLVDLIFSHRRKIIWVWVGLLGFFSVGIYRLDVETDIVLWFSKQTEIRRSYEEIRGKLSGITPVNVVIAARSEESVVSPRALVAIHGLASYLESLPTVGKALSVADPLIQIHSGFNSGLGDTLPLDANLISQYLLLLSSVELMDDVLTFDRKGANIVLRLDVNGSRRIVDIDERVRNWWREYGHPSFSVTTTGIMFEFGRAEEEIAYGQVRGLGMALMAIATILFLIFRDIRIAVSALIPNVIPLAIGYGFMGIAGIPLDAATICIGSLALGIAVDDTIHVTSEFASRRRSGLTDRDALAGSFKRVVPALVYSTGALAVGFGVVGLSDFSLIRNLGLVTSAMVVICLLADLTLLPALLISKGERSRFPN